MLLHNVKHPLHLRAVVHLLRYYPLFVRNTFVHVKPRTVKQVLLCKIIAGVQSHEIMSSMKSITAS